MGGARTIAAAAPVPARTPLAALAGLLVAALLLALAASPAAAFRTPDAEELAAMAGAAGPPVEPRCVTARISTVDPRWGALSAKRGEGCTSPPFVWVLRRPDPGEPGSRWSELRQDVRFGVCATGLPGIPVAVGTDLGVCTAASKELFVPVGRRLAIRPRRLPWGVAASVTGIRWSRWGGARAVGRGTFRYADPYGPVRRVAVTVTLSAIDTCGSRRTYLAKQLTAVAGRDRATVRAYTGRWFQRCP